MAYKTLIAQISFWLLLAIAVVVGAVEYEEKNVFPFGDSSGQLVSGTAGDSYVTSTGFQWVADLVDEAGLFSLCYYVTSTIGTPQVAIKYQVAPSSETGYVNPVDSSGTDISQLVDDTSNIGGTGNYCIPGDYFPTWTNSMRFFPWGRVILYGVGTNPSDTYMSNVWLIRY